MAAAILAIAAGAFDLAENYLTMSEIEISVSRLAEQSDLIGWTRFFAHAKFISAFLCALVFLRWRFDDWGKIISMFIFVILALSSIVGIIGLINKEGLFLTVWAMHAQFAFAPLAALLFVSLHQRFLSEY